VFGFILSRIGFADFSEVHRMFVFADLRLFLAFAVGVGLSMIGFVIFSKLSKMPPRPLHPGSVIGGILFGVGWAITGACPAIVLVQVGEGQLAGLATLAGLAIGVVLYPPVHRRFFRWDVGSCSM
jgi:uncharacterized membrane protein YedE/YeeE